MEAPDQDAPRVTVALHDEGRATALEGALATEGFVVARAADVRTAVERARDTRADVVVVDDALPGGGALESIRALRADADPFVLLVASDHDDMQCIVALSAGADDVVARATSDREVAARCRALIRRSRASWRADGPIRVGGLELHPDSRTAWGAGGPLALTRTEFEILRSLVEVPRTVVERRQLCDRVWGARWSGDAHALDVHVSNLRAKLAAAGDPIRLVTIRGVGFRADPPD